MIMYAYIHNISIQVSRLLHPQLIYPQVRTSFRDFIVKRIRDAHLGVHPAPRMFNTGVAEGSGDLQFCPFGVAGSGKKCILPCSLLRKVFRDLRFYDSLDLSSRGFFLFRIHTPEIALSASRF